MKLLQYLLPRKSTPALLALTGILSSTTQAMPYYKTDDALKSMNASAIASDPVLSGSAIFSDHVARN
ncbi:MAG: hypothetical protein EOP09_19040, partial [Proteobacteria bacterium]